MKKELEYFRVGKCFGCNQDIVIDPVLHFAGCGAIVACESSAYLAWKHNCSRLCTGAKEQWRYFEYYRFLKTMKPFLYPGKGGISRLDLFVNGFSKYMDAQGENCVRMNEFSAERSLEDAQDAVRAQINRGLLIPFLMLRNQHSELKDFVWHWFLLTGYDESDDGFQVRLTSYGEHKWFDLSKLWDTGYEEKGGMILYELVK